MKTLLNYLQENGFFVNAICNGKGTCGKCKVLMKNVPANDKDKKFLTTKEIEEGYVLACQHSYDEYTEIASMKHSGEILTTFDKQMKKTVFHVGYGIIVDIGTTTVVLNLIDLKTGEIIDVKSVYNPQISYGGDVITRIEYDTMYPHILSQCIRKCIEKNIISWMKHDIKQMILTGNTTMIHIFHDINTKPLGVAPFEVPQKKQFECKAKDVFTINQDFNIITLPHIGAYVGSDIVSGMYALNFYQRDTTSIFLDLGTNGEIVAGNRNHMYAVSSAAGPAFEGGGIACGGASVDGAIYRVSSKGNDLHLYTINDKKPTCICGTGVISIIAYLRKKDLINELGRFKDGSNRFYLNEEIYISNQDIQNFLLAKSAIQTALHIMLQLVKIVDRICISGGFGSKLNLDDLITLKIIPPDMKEKVVIKKNTALQGIYQLLLNQDFEVLDDMIQHIKPIELSTYDDFEDLLIEGLYI